MAVFRKIDSSEVNSLTISLEHAPKRVVDNVGQVFANEADALNRDMRRDASGHRYLPKFARTITAQKVSELHHVIGFNKVGQGQLANIIMFGSVNNAPVYNFYGPLIRRTPAFLEHLGRVSEDSIFTQGGWG